MRTWKLPRNIPGVGNPGRCTNHRLREHAPEKSWILLARSAAKKLRATALWVHCSCFLFVLISFQGFFFFVWRRPTPVLGRVREPRYNFKCGKIVHSPMSHKGQHAQRKKEKTDSRDKEKGNDKKQNRPLQHTRRRACPSARNRSYGADDKVETEQTDAAESGKDVPKRSLPSPFFYLFISAVSATTLSIDFLSVSSIIKKKGGGRGGGESSFI